ncbi:MAG TPA: formate dehydrogenase subunit delta [Rhizomicrobium sp.]|nr:formate dehydrogenase subunit delta [Rhizomicrobium sp.]
MLSYEEKLVYMANQICDFFKAQGEAKAVPAIADHINKFWDPKMREDFLRLTPDQLGDLKDLARKAVAQVRAPSKA